MTEAGGRSWPRAALLSSFPRSVLAIALLALGIRAVVALVTRFTNEDALITLRYAENLAHGLGFVYNPGERVLGTTTPLFTLLLAGFTRAGLPALEWGKALTILADGGLCLAVYAWGRALGREETGRLAAVVVAVHPLHIRWSVSGMETSLVALGTALAFLAWVERRERRLGVLLGLLFLLRWDTVLPATLLGGGWLLRERRAPWRGVGLAALLILPWLTFATLYFGSPIPGTAGSKLAVYTAVASLDGEMRLFPGAPTLPSRLVTDPLYPLVLALVLLGIGTLLRRPAEPVQAAAVSPLTTLIPAVWLFATWTLLSVTPVPLFEWYLVPPLWAADWLMSAGVVSLTARIPAGGLPWKGVRALGLAAAGVAVWQGGWNCARTQAIEERLRKPLALWLRDQARPGETVLLEPIGYVGYYSRLRVLDVIGLVSPEVVPYWKRNPRSALWELVQSYGPEWCVLRPRELAHMRAAAGADWERTYRSVASFRYRRPGDPGTFVFHLYQRNPT